VRVVEVSRFGGPEVLVPVDSPDPVAGPGELVVAVTASDVMFLDTMVRSGRGTDFFPTRPPYVPGSGVAGTVLSVGEGVDHRWAGQQVIAHTGGPGGGGGYAGQAIAKLADTVLVPDGLDPLQAAAVIHDGPTALRVIKVIDVRPGEQVLVLGAAGGMGILLVQLLRAGDVLAGKVRPLIGQTFPLTEAARAHAMIEAREAIAKTLLIVDPATR
jgi:NADPH:quinone reductase